MKKIICILMILTILASMIICSFAATPTKAAICAKFNEYFAELNKMGTSQTTATATSEGIDLTFDVMASQVFFKFYLTGNILTGEFVGENKNSAKMYGMYLIEAIEVLQGYKQYEYFQYANQTNLAGLTIEEDGIQLDEDNESVKFTIDISKKAPIVDVNSIYGKISDYEKNDDKIRKGTYTGVFGNVVLYSKKESNGNYTIYIGQKGGLKNAAVQTIVYYIEYIAGKQTSLAFFAKCKNLVEDTSFTDFVIDYNVIPDIESDLLFTDDYKVSKIIYKGKTSTYTTPTPTAVPKVTATPFDADFTPTPEVKEKNNTLSPDISYAPLDVDDDTTIAPKTTDNNNTFVPSSTLEPGATENPDATEITNIDFTNEPEITENPYDIDDETEDDGLNEINLKKIVPIIIGGVIILIVAIIIILVKTKKH